MDAMETFPNGLTSDLSSRLTSSGEFPETTKTSFISSRSKLHEYPMFSAVSATQTLNVNGDGGSKI